MTLYGESDVNRQHSERLRNDAVRLMRQTAEKTVQGQREAGRRLGERLTDLTFWRNELSIELEKVIAEYSLLADMKRRTTKALEDLDPPLKTTEECLYFRENRQGVEKVHDIVEKTLLTEVKNIRNAQDKLKQCLEQVNILLECFFFHSSYRVIVFIYYSSFAITNFYTLIIRSINYYQTCVQHNIHSKRILFIKKIRLASIPYAIK